MPTLRDLADAIIRMEGSMLPSSLNMRMVREHGLWNVGHLVWAGQRGAVPVEINGRLWAGWPSYEEAYEGLMRQIRLDASRGLTLEQFIAKYAPPSENNTAAYIANVSAWTGIPPNMRLDALPESGPPLVYASLEPQAGAEGGETGIELASAAAVSPAAILLGGAILGGLYLLRRG